MENAVPQPVRHTSLRGRSSECAVLDELLAAVRRGESRSLVLRGEAGIGKTALLKYLIATASDLTVARAVGVESEMELAYASLHQLCGGLLDGLESLPSPQRRALEVVFGLNAGDAPDRFLVGLAVLSLLSEAADERPVLCIVDDAQWLDQSSAASLAFVARRLLADHVGLVFAAREPAKQLRGLAELAVMGLPTSEAQALVESAAPFRVNEQVRERIVAEARGNPLALVELARGLSATELAGFGAQSVSAASDGMEERFRRRLTELPEDTRRLLMTAAADPLGDPTIVWLAAAQQGIKVEAVAPAEETGLCEFGARIRFRHPLVRAAAYTALPAGERRRAHAALAQVTDADADPDRRAWHRALASAGPDEAVADELERSAARARARGGQAGAAAFFERAMELTLDPARRAERAIAAADAAYLAGSAEDALRLAAVARGRPLDEFQRARLDALRGRLATMQRRAGEAPPPLLGAARRLEPFDRRAAREAYRDAFIAAIYAGRLAGGAGLSEVAAAVRVAARTGQPPSAADELLDAAALLIDAGWAAGAAGAAGALADFLASPADDMRWLVFAYRVAVYLWDYAAWDALTVRMLERVHDTGTLGLLPIAVASRVGWNLLAGDLTAASALVVEQDTVQEAIGGDPSPGSRMALAAFRGREAEVNQLDEATTSDAIARGDGQWLALLHWSTAVLCNGLGRYDEALKAAQLGTAHPVGQHVSSWALSELVEAAARSGRPDEAADALGRLAEMARACRTDWVLGIEARARALVADRRHAEELHREAIEHLDRTPFRTELGRARLLYGEWLRREARRVDAREQLRTAHRMFTSMGLEGFATRAERELRATGETARKRTADTRDELTAQETQIAELARDGLSNVDIGTRLFISPRTVEYHLHKVFAKLGIKTREHLDRALPVDTGAQVQRIDQ
jgi:DNA-binding CsgD family transcriptional regulator